MVVPPMLQAAIPVEAVTQTASGRERCLILRFAIISRSRTDLPVPEEEEDALVHVHCLFKKKKATHLLNQ